MKKQRHILIAWELGGGLGHITRISSIAAGFIAECCRVSLCLKDLSRAYEFVSHLPIGLYQAPAWLPQLRTDREPVCSSDILLHHGYGSAKGLFSLTMAWQSLFEILQPDLLVLDYAPTALLAARGWDMPKIVISSGFGERSPGLPDLCLRPWHEQGKELTLASEKLVVSVANRVLIKRGARLLKRVSDIYQVDHFFLFMIPEIDMQKDWESATYLRPPEEPGRMEPAAWPQGAGQKVFAYLKPSSVHCLATIQSIAELDCVGLIVCAGLSKKVMERFKRPGLEILTEPRYITKALEGADVVVCHAGKNTISQALLVGKPVLLIPEQLEQFLNSLQVEKQGAGTYIRKDASQDQIRDALAQLMNESRFREASQSLAKRNADLNQGDPVAKIVGYCEQLMANSFS